MTFWRRPSSRPPEIERALELERKIRELTKGRAAERDEPRSAGSDALFHDDSGAFADPGDDRPPPIEVERGL